LYYYWGINAIGGWGVIRVGICVLGVVIAIAVVIAVAINWANFRPIVKPLRVWFSLACSIPVIFIGGTTTFIGRAVMFVNRAVTFIGKGSSAGHFKGVAWVV
jgi:hypothetical protein